MTTPGRPTKYTAKLGAGRQRVAIYGLVDPAEGVVRYVGKTKSPKRRIAQHRRWTALGGANLKEQWVRQLCLRGRSPDMVILERCWSRDWQDREMYWIKLLGEDHALVNGTPGGDRPPSGLGAGRKGRKQRPLQRMQIAIQSSIREDRAAGRDPSVHVESLRRVKGAIESTATRVGGLVRAREVINRGLLERGW